MCDVFRIGDSVVDPESNEITGPGGSIHVEPMLMKLLLFLVEHRGQVLPKRQIIDQVWDQEVVGDEVLANGIWRLRRALGDSAKEPRFIQTIPRRGYRLIAEVLVVAEADSQAEETAADEEASGRQRQTTVSTRPQVHGPQSDGTLRRLRRLTVGRVVVASAAAMAVVAAWWVARGPAEPAVSIGRTRRVTSAQGEECFPALSPDGGMITYVAGPAGSRDLVVQQVAGGRALKLTAGLQATTWEWPQWSPDGNHVVFSSWGGPTRVYQVPALGGPARLLLELPDFYTCAALSPDGERLAFAHGDAVHLRTVAGDEPERKLIDLAAAHFLAWSPDGSRIACVAGNRRYLTFGNIAPSTIWVISVDDGTAVRVTHNGSLNMSPVWTPDGHSLLYLSDIEGSRDLFQVALEPGGRVGEPRRLTTGLNATSISIAADGSRLAYSVTSRQANIWSLPIPVQGVRSSLDALPVTTGSQVIEALDVTADGRWLVYDSNRNGNQDIFRMRLPDGEPQQLTTHASDDFGPSLSPDGAWIAFYSMRHGNRDLFVMAADGRDLIRVTRGPGQERYPDWSCDGDRLVFDCPDNGALKVLERSSTGRWSSPVLLDANIGFARAARWSPSCDRIAVATPDAIVVLRAAGGAARRLVTRDDRSVPVPWTVSWSTDGHTLYIKSYDQNNVQSIWAVVPDSGDRRVLVEFPVPMPRSVGPDFAVDAERFYFTMPKTEGDIWVAELVSP